MKKYRWLWAVAVVLVSLYANAIESPQELNTSNVATNPNQWAQVFTDALKQKTNADASFLAAGFFCEAKLPKGEVSLDDVSKALRYPTEEIAVIQLTGDQIKAAFERALGLFPQRNSAYLQVSGFKVEFKASEPVGSRVTSILINGKAIVSDKKYKIATSATLANGALGYFKIWSKDAIIQTLNISVREVTDEYLKDKEVLPLDNNPRIVSK